MNPLQMVFGPPRGQQQAQAEVEDLPDHGSMLERQLQAYAQANNRDKLTPEEFESVYNKFYNEFTTRKVPAGRDSTAYKEWMKRTLGEGGAEFKARSMAKLQESGFLEGMPAAAGQTEGGFGKGGVTGAVLSAPGTLASTIAGAVGGGLEYAGTPGQMLERFAEENVPQDSSMAPAMMAIPRLLGGAGRAVSGAGAGLADSAERLAEMNRQATMTPEQLQQRRDAQISREVAYQQAGGGMSGVAAQFGEALATTSGREAFDTTVQAAPWLLGSGVAMAKAGMKGLMGFSGALEAAGSATEARREVDRLFSDPEAKAAFMQTPDGKKLIETSMQATGGNEQQAMDLAKSVIASDAKMWAGTLAGATGALTAGATARMGGDVSGIVARMLPGKAAQATAGAAAAEPARAASSGGLMSGLKGALGGAGREGLGEAGEELAVEIAGGVGHRAAGLPTDPLAQAGQAAASGLVGGVGTGGAVGFAGGYAGDPNAPAAAPAPGADGQTTGGTIESVGVNDPSPPEPSQATITGAPLKAFQDAQINPTEYLNPNRKMYVADLKSVVNDMLAGPQIANFSSAKGNAGVISDQLNKLRVQVVSDPNKAIESFDFGNPDSAEYTTFLNKLSGDPTSKPFIMSPENQGAATRLAAFLAARKEQYDKDLAPTEDRLDAYSKRAPQLLANYMILNNEQVKQSVLKNADQATATAIRQQLAGKKGDGYRGVGDTFAIISKMNDNSVSDILKTLESQQGKLFGAASSDAVRTKARSAAQMSAASKLADAIRATRVPLDIGKASNAELIAAAYRTDLKSLIKDVSKTATPEGQAIRGAIELAGNDVDIASLTQVVKKTAGAIAKAKSKQSERLNSANDAEVADARRNIAILDELSRRAEADRPGTTAPVANDMALIFGATADSEVRKAVEKIIAPMYMSDPGIAEQARDDIDAFESLLQDKKQAEPLMRALVNQLLKTKPNSKESKEVLRIQKRLLERYRQLPDGPEDDGGGSSGKKKVKGKQGPDDSFTSEPSAPIESETPNKIGAFSFSGKFPEPLRGLAIEWAKLLKLDEKNVSFYTKREVANSKRISASLKSSIKRANGALVSFMDDTYIILIDTDNLTQRKYVETLAHELGHLHERVVFNEAPKEVKDSILEEYRKWKDQSKKWTAKQLVENLRSYQSAKNILDRIGEKYSQMPAIAMSGYQGYWSSFPEWYADNVARWANTTAEPVGVVEQFFKGLADTLRKFFSDISNSQWFANSTFAEYMNGVTGAAKASAPAQPPVLLLPPPTTSPPPPAMTEYAEAVRAAQDELVRQAEVASASRQRDHLKSILERIQLLTMGLASSVGAPLSTDAYGEQQKVSDPRSPSTDVASNIGALNKKAEEASGANDVDRLRAILDRIKELNSDIASRIAFGMPDNLDDADYGEQQRASDPRSPSSNFPQASREKTGVADNTLFDGGIVETQVTNARDGTEVAGVIERAIGKPVDPGDVQIVDPVLTREEARVIQAITGGKPVVFYTVKDGTAGSSARGFFDPATPGRVYVRAAKGMMTFVAGHEFAHNLQLSNPTLFTDLQAKLQELAQAGVIIDDEAVADTWGAMVTGSTRYLSAIGESSPPGFFARVLEAISKFWNEKILGIKNDILNRKDIEQSVLNGLYTDAEAVKSIVHRYIEEMVANGQIESAPEGTLIPQLSQQRQKVKPTDRPERGPTEVAAGLNTPGSKISANRIRQKIFNQHYPLYLWVENIERVLKGKLADKLNVYARMLLATGVASRFNMEDQNAFVEPIRNRLSEMRDKYGGSAAAPESEGGFGVKSRGEFVDMVNYALYAVTHAEERNYMHMLLHSDLRAEATRARDRIIRLVKQRKMSRGEAISKLDALVRDPTNVKDGGLLKYGSGLTDSDIARWKKVVARLGMEKDLEDLNRNYLDPIRKRQDEHLTQARALSDGDNAFKQFLGFKNYLPSKGFFDPNDNFLAPKYSATNIYDTSFIKMQGRVSLGRDFISNLINDMYDFGRVNANTPVREALVNALQLEEKRPDLKNIRFAGTNTLANLSQYFDHRELKAGEAALYEAGGLPDKSFIYRDDNKRIWLVQARKETEGAQSFFPEKREYKERMTMKEAYGEYRETLSEDKLTAHFNFLRNTIRNFVGGGWLEMFSFAGSVYGRLLIAWNPTSWGRQAVMDYTYFNHSMATYYGAKSAAAMSAKAGEYYASALKYETTDDLDKALQDGRAAIKKNEDSYLRWMTEFWLTGGRFTMMDSLKIGNNRIKESLAADSWLDDAMRKLGADTSKRNAIQRFEGISNAGDMANRVAAFREIVLNKKESKERAAAAVKGFMNYEESGSSQKLRAIMPLFVFLRPVIAGTSAAGRQLTAMMNGTPETGAGLQNAGTFWMVAFGLIGYMAIMAMDDDELEALAPENATRSLQIPGEYQIPVSYGLLQSVFAVGSTLAMMERNKVDDWEGTGLILRAVSQNMAPIPASPANPTENPGWWVGQTLTPTMIRVFGTNLYSNKDDFGRPIWLEENPNRYDFENFKENTPQLFRDIAKGIFEQSGKTIDWSPEFIQYITRQLGGIGSTLNNYLKMEVMREKGIDVGEGTGPVLKQTLFSPFVNRDELNSGFRMWNDVKDKLAEYQKAVNSPTVGEKVGPIDPQVLSLGRLSKQLDSEYTRLRDAVRKATTPDQRASDQRRIELWYRDAVRRYNMLAPEDKRMFLAKPQQPQ